MDARKSCKYQAAVSPAAPAATSPGAGALAEASETWAFPGAPSALAFEAQGLNLTTTHLGFILAGRNHVERVIDEDIDAEFVEAHGKDLSAKNADPADYERRRKIALETVRLSSDDSLTGRECVSRTLGSARESAMHYRQKRHVAHVTLDNEIKG